MTLYEANHSLFIATRDPAELIVFDTDSDKVGILSEYCTRS